MYLGNQRQIVETNGVQSMGCRSEARGGGRSKTMENLIYKLRSMAFVQVEHSYAEGQSQQLPTWADLTGSEPKTRFPYRAVEVPMFFSFLLARQKLTILTKNSCYFLFSNQLSRFASQINFHSNCIQQLLLSFHLKNEKTKAQIEARPKSHSIRVVQSRFKLSHLGSRVHCLKHVIISNFSSISLFLSSILQLLDEFLISITPFFDS